MSYQTPGVYVEEISVLPPSVVSVATAIPAFLGYTEKAVDENGKAVTGLFIKRIDSFKDYKDFFGGARLTSFVAAQADGKVNVVAKELGTNTDLGTIPEYLMYYSVKMHFDNGGGSCYIVSVGRYGDTIATADFEAGLTALKKEDEPTLIIMVDAVHLGSSYVLLCQQVLAQCGELKDRFGIFDILEGDDDAEDFRNGIGTDQLKYGAAYMPYLRTGMSYAYSEADVTLEGVTQHSTGDNGLHIMYDGDDATPQMVVVEAGASLEITVDAATGTLNIAGVTASGAAASDIVTAWADVTDRGGFSLSVLGDGTDTISAGTSDVDDTVSMWDIRSSQTQLYNNLKATLAKERVVLPPSSAIAGLYARVDRNRGVWKAPANESLSNVLEPILKIDNGEQAMLNVDATSGKSINAIRSFAGKGVMVWGARTLAGNDNEWRYVNVRRLFILIEESIQKATGFVVFEPNDATTWLKVKALIESFLYGLWQQGALAGPTPEAAYFVNVGLGKTMTTQDILEGRLIVEIGVAAVRPAEFVVLRFFHKLQEA